MEFIICICAIIAIFVYFTLKLILDKSKSTSVKEETSWKKDTKQNLSISGAYKKRWLLTYNEKDAYKKLNDNAEEIGYTVFSKVRLLDLLEPVSGVQNYRSYFYKVQAKHVDFVLLDKKLVARCIVELDDSSHDADNRKVRDAFVDEVVTSVGYQIVHTRSITDETINQIRMVFQNLAKD